MDNPSPQVSSASEAPGTRTVPILIIGCGFGGIATAIALKKAGMQDFRILERAADVGGVWRDNSYPGAACDLVSRYYSLSCEQDYPWSEPFGPRDEIFDYIHKVVDKYRVREHVSFNTDVASARYDDQSALWTVSTRDGATLTAPILISAVGIFNHPQLPDIPGRESFAGKSFHSAWWDHGYALEGKTIGVIGNGASCVQFLPEIAPKAKQVHLFQRSPQYVFPKSVFPGTSALDKRLGASRWLRPLARLKVFLGLESFVLRRQKNERRLQGEAWFAKMLEDKSKDPVLRRKLTPDYPLGCKRQLASDRWYDTLVRPNVEVVDTAIVSIDAGGLYLRDGTERKVDAIIYGTGFTPTEFLQPMQVTGRGGRELREAWRHGAEAYLGISVAGFPNFFMLYGPNTNGGGIIFMLECQARYIVDCIRTLRRRKARSMSVRAETQRLFTEELNERLSRTVWARTDCRTYVKTAEGRVTTQWPGLSTEYNWRTRRARAADYEFA